MTETTALIEKVFTQSGNNSKGDWTRYDVKAEGKKFQTFVDALGEKAQSLQKETAKITYKESESNGYTNYTITAIEAASGATVNAETVKGTGPEDDRQLRIMRQSALERAIRAAELLGLNLNGVSDLYDVADEFVRYFIEGQQVPAEDAGQRH